MNNLVSYTAFIQNIFQYVEYLTNYSEK